jgi:hypothetical protein
MLKDDFAVWTELLTSAFASNPVANAPAPKLMLRKKFLLVGFIF